MKAEYIFLGLAWALSLFQYTWLLGRDERGEVPRVSGKSRTPFTSWVVGTMLVVDCDGGSSQQAVQLLDRVREQVRVTGIVLRHECESVDVEQLRTHAVDIRVVVWFSPLVSAEVGGTLGGGLLSQGKLYTRRHDRGLAKGHLIDFDSDVGKAWVEKRLRELIEKGATGVYCDPIDHVLLGSTGELSTKRYVNQRDYSRAYYWHVFDIGRDIVGYDFVVLGAGVTSFGTVTDTRLLPNDRGMASVLQVYNTINTNKEGLLETAHAAFKAAQHGYLNFATAPIPLSIEGPFVDENILSVQFSAALPLLLLTHSLSKAVPNALHPAVLVNAAFHAELQPYFHAASSYAAEMNESIVSPLHALGTHDVHGTHTDRSFYLGKNLFVCPIMDTAGSVECKPPSGNWKKATSRIESSEGSMAVASYRSPVYVLKRVGVGLPLRPSGKVSPLMWNQYGMPAPQSAVLTLLFDSPAPVTILDVTGPSRKHCLQTNVTIDDGLTVRLTPWDDPLLVVLRNIPASPPFIVRYKKEPFNTTDPLFEQQQSLWGLHKKVGSVDDSSYFIEGRDVFLAVPPVPRGATLLLFKRT